MDEADSAIDAASRALWSVTGGGRLTTGKMIRVIVEAAEPWIVVAEQRRITRLLRNRATRAESAGDPVLAHSLREVADRVASAAEGEPELT